jgi:hypothetical protein
MSSETLSPAPKLLKISVTLRIFPSKNPTVTILKSPTFIPSPLEVGFPQLNRLVLNFWCSPPFQNHDQKNETQHINAANNKHEKNHKMLLLTLKTAILLISTKRAIKPYSDLIAQILILFTGSIQTVAKPP